MEIYVDGKIAVMEIGRSHLGRYWLIKDESNSATWTIGDGWAIAFSTREKAEQFIARQKFETKPVAREFLWEDLPRVMGKHFHAIVVENSKMPGSYLMLPLNIEEIK